MDFDTSHSRQFRENRPEFPLLSRGEIRDLLKLCSDPRRPGRDEALRPLLYAENAPLPGYYLRLAAHLASMRIRVCELPPELLGVFFELIASGEKLPAGATGKFLRSIVSRCPRRLLSRLMEKRYPIAPFLDSIRPRLSHAGARSVMSKNRWRLLRKFLAESGSRPLPDEGLEITLADLRPLFAPRGRAPAWRTRAKHLVARPVPAPPAASPAFGGLYWEGRGNLDLAFRERLADAQAAELAEVRRLAEEVSGSTGRVVFSWHNASLAAAGGWGLEWVPALPSPVLDREFARSVSLAADDIRRSLDEDAVSALFEMRTRRIFAPKAARALEHYRALADLGPSHGAELARASRLASALLSADEIDDILTGAKSEWSGALAPHQRVSLDRLLAWIGHDRPRWAEGFCRLLALARRGREALDSGLVSSFVIPWIDKFFISSRRQADRDYLELLFKLVRTVLEEPLVLLWEDTAHAKLPSLGLALSDMAARGLPFKGLGIFDPLGSMRADAARIIREEYPARMLFALRPSSDNHAGDAFRRIFHQRDPGFIRDYDSSWKDNLVFLYAGTQVYPLLSPQTEMESISPWVATGGVRCPFGSWFRGRLRFKARTTPDEPRDRLRRAHAAWANLL